jgi:hypothetical protein
MSNLKNYFKGCFDLLLYIFFFFITALPNLSQFAGSAGK